MKYGYHTLRIYKSRFLIALALIIAILITAIFGMKSLADPDFYETKIVNSEEKKFIKWVSFNVTLPVLKQALDYDIKSQNEQVKLNWIELLAIAACQNGGNFSNKRNTYIDKIVERLRSGEKLDSITEKLKNYSYYHESYTAVLNGFVGKFKIEEYDESSSTGKSVVEKYGLKVFSPIARGYGYSHSDDFGNSRSYGFRRKHLGNDLVGSIGTPVIAVEDGIIESMGWNKYGGWRIGIRSMDFKRYYYYAHLRKKHPYVEGLKEGMEVKAGDVIGYLGMTGYSTKEDYNGMRVPHLHFGIQLIFDDSQKEGYGEIWIDVYNIVKFLQNTRSKVEKNENTGDFQRTYNFVP